MAHYRYQQIPGIDHLCRQTAPLLLAVKQVSSAARQLGRRACSPRSSASRAIPIPSRISNGLAIMIWCWAPTSSAPPHPVLGARAPQARYPPNWNYQQTYWPELRPLNDYFTRLCYALTRGQAQVEVLLLHPIESGTAGRRLAVQSTHTMPGEDLRAAERADVMLRRALEGDPQRRV